MTSCSNFARLPFSSRTVRRHRRGLLPPDEHGVAARWRGIGIRIEVDIAITRDGPQVLTAAMPRDATEIEYFLAQR